MSSDEEKMTNDGSLRRDEEVRKVSLMEGAVNFLLLVLKFVAAIIGRSSAMMADAIHSLGDFCTDVIALLFVKWGSRKKDDRHDYGYGKYATLTALVVSVVFFAIGLTVIYKAVVDIMDFIGGIPIGKPTYVALVAALVSVLVNFLLYRITKEKAGKLNSWILLANSRFHRGDALSSVCTTLGIAGAMFMGWKWQVLDPVAAIVVALFILRSAYVMFMGAADELLDKALPEQTERQIADMALELDEVKTVEGVLSRKIAGKVSVELVVTMDGTLSLEEVDRCVGRIEYRLNEHFGELAHVAVHVKPAENE